MNVTFTTSKKDCSGTLVVGVYKDKELTEQAETVNNLTQAAITKAIDNSKFNGDYLENLVVNGAPSEAPKIILIGLGVKENLSDIKVEKLGGIICKHTLKDMSDTVKINFPCLCDQPGHCSALLAMGYQLKSWEFLEYRTEIKDNEKPKVNSLIIVTEDTQHAESVYKEAEAIIAGVNITKNVTSQPGNVIYPETMVEQAKELSKLDVKVNTMGEKELQDKGMNALYGVGMGSDKESFLCTMEWNGGASDQQPICIVGKGITFDTGGISIKGRAGLDEMKFDMGGAGVVLGLMHTLASRKAPVNVVGVMALAENMCSGTAQRPGDIVKSYSGKTIEILDTDAEGRLVLADALWYAQETYKPQAMIDLATLTGAIMVSLGYEYAGLFSNNDELAEQLAQVGELTDEKVWRMPLHSAYNKQIDSKIADVKNLGGRWGGSITAAQFLQRFVNKVPWVHLDIAGAAWNPKGRALSAPGSTAFGVRLLNRYIKENYG